jgi:GNAT superfamily N-acetyltransferase
MRSARTGDGPGCARVWVEVGTYYAAMDPEAFQIPAEAGLAEWFDAGNATDRRDELRLVAVRDGSVVGFVLATLQPPASAPERQLVRGLDLPRVLVSALAVATSHQRSGIGSALMAQVENWALANRAGTVVLDTFADSPLSVPFYGRKLGYARQAIVFRKTLGRRTRG